jgi:galactokinase
VLALSKLYGIEKDKTTLAKIGQKAEHTFAGCPCGLLDQASSMYGKAGALVKSDFRTNEFESVPMGDGVAFMMVKSNAKHALVDGAYASRRQACEDAAKYFAGVFGIGLRKRFHYDCQTKVSRGAAAMQQKGQTIEEIQVSPSDGSGKIRIFALTDDDALNYILEFLRRAFR